MAPATFIHVSTAQLPASDEEGENNEKDTHPEGISPFQRAVNKVRNASTGNAAACHYKPEERGVVAPHIELTPEGEEEETEENDGRSSVANLESLGEEVSKGLTKGSHSYLLTCTSRSRREEES
jgi:hypothetical protein